MNSVMNKKFDRFKQWAGERMGNEAKTAVSEEFKMLESEMTLRHEGMEKLHSSMSIYIRSLSKRKEGDDKEKMLPLDALAAAMIYHGEEFDTDSVFGNCLIKMGLANEKIGRLQDNYVSRATESWFDSMGRALAQMKDYQTARKKLESRRLAYDATLTKMQKQKREDFRLEEELRSQRAKYEESMEDVTRRMSDIQHMEEESVRELTAFLDAELEYYDKARNTLLELRRNWPAGEISNSRTPRARSFSTTPRDESPPPLPVQPSIRSRSDSTSNSGYRESEKARRQPAFEGPTQIRANRNFAEPPNLPTPHVSSANRNYRTITQLSQPRADTQYSPRSESGKSSPDRHHYHHQDDAISPTSTNSGRIGSRNNSTASLSQVSSYTSSSQGARKPPPPPVSRGSISGTVKKAPPPPPAKRPSLSGNKE